MKYYIEDENQPNGFSEVSETEYNALFGDSTIRSYVQSVYLGDISIDEVPLEHREDVQAVVSNKISRWGESNYELSDSEFRAMVEGAM